MARGRRRGKRPTAQNMDEADRLVQSLALPPYQEYPSSKRIGPLLQPVLTLADNSTEQTLSLCGTATPWQEDHAVVNGYQANVVPKAVVQVNALRIVPVDNNFYDVTLAQLVGFVRTARFVVDSGGQTRVINMSSSLTSLLKAINLGGTADERYIFGGGWVRVPFPIRFDVENDAADLVVTGINSGNAHTLQLQILGAMFPQNDWEEGAGQADTCAAGFSLSPDDSAQFQGEFSRDYPGIGVFPI